MKNLAAALIALLFSAAPVVAQQRVSLAPSSIWVLDYANDSCALQRKFGESGQQVFLEMRQFGPVGDLQMVVVSPDFDRRSGAFKVAFEPRDIEPREFELFDFNLAPDQEGKLFSYDQTTVSPAYREVFAGFLNTSDILTEHELELVRRALELDPDSRAMERLAGDNENILASQRATWAFAQSEAFRNMRDETETAHTGIRVEDAFRQTLFLETGPLHTPMEALRTCVAELMTHWGIDAAAHNSLTRQAEPVDRANWARRVQGSYPSSMSARGMQGFLRTRLSVSAQGDVTSCVFQTQINNAAFERAACDNLIQAKFNPALDAQSQPIASYYLISIVYSVG